MSHRRFKSVVERKLARPVVSLVLVTTLGVALVGCGGSKSAEAPTAPVVSQRAVCERTYGSALRAMRSLMAEVTAGMTVGTFDDEYPKMAGPVQLADDAALKPSASACPAVLMTAFDNLFEDFKASAQNGKKGSTNWSASYDDLQAQIDALQ